MPSNCTDTVNLGCPAGPNCNGTCQFKVCANWRIVGPPPPNNNMQNLTVTFEGSTAANPLVGPPAELETAASGCAWNFNMGDGYVEYIDTNGNRHRLDRATFFRERRRLRRGLNARDGRECRRLHAKGHCPTWTPEERTWYLDNCLQKSTGGWDLTWKCQPNEPETGMSVTELKPTGNPQIRSFKLNFKIKVTCSCGAAKNEAILEMKVSEP